MAKIKCPYTYPHRSRAAKVNYICGVGGYGSRYGRFPIEFNVGAYNTNFEFDHLWKTYYEEMTPSELKHDPEACALYYRLAMRLHKEHEDHLWEWGQEDACRNLQDGDTYRMLWDGTDVDVELELHGRSGKHLVIQYFEGTTFEGQSPEDLEEWLMEQTLADGEEVSTHTRLQRGAEWSVSAKKLDKLYRYIRQCEVDFTTEKASAEVEYQGAFQFFANIVEPAWEEEKKNAVEHAAVVGCAQTLRRYLAERDGAAVLQMLRTLSQAAGVTEDELWEGD